MFSLPPRRRTIHCMGSNLLMMFAEALTRSGDDDSTAELLLEGLAKSSVTDVVHGLRTLVTTKLYSSRVLRRRGRDADAKTL